MSRLSQPGSLQAPKSCHHASAGRFWFVLQVSKDAAGHEICNSWSTLRTAAASGMHDHSNTSTYETPTAEAKRAAMGITTDS
eukprot:6011387-Karenia_brevis.AAC.1